MKISWTRCNLAICALVVTFRSAETIKCYRCTSTDVENNTLQCNEYFDDTDLEPQPCDDIHDARYCIKQIGRFEGRIGTKRDCSSVDMGNYCNYVQLAGDKLEYRSCYFTCTGDGCNAAPAGAELAGVIFFLAAALVVLRQAVPF